MISKERLTEIYDLLISTGEEQTKSKLGFSDETWSRYKRELRKHFNIDRIDIINNLVERYTDKELEAISKGGRIVPGMAKVPIVNFEGETIRFGAYSDTHMGSVYFDEPAFNSMVDVFNSENLDFVVHCGDVTEGMSTRDGHFYELEYVGYKAQKDYAVTRLSKIKTKQYFIDGNHDRWYMKIANIGACIVEDICKELPNAEFLGHDEGDISLNGKAVLKLMHGEDGSTYALSYRLQKWIESFQGGEKPGMFLIGHAHKYCEVFCRNVYGIEVGAMCKQSAWMRRTRKENHHCFLIIEATVNDDGISKVRKTHYPVY